MQEGNESLGMLENVQFERKTVTLSPVTYIIVGSKKLGSDLFHVGSVLIGSESIKTKTRPSE